MPDYYVIAELPQADGTVKRHVTGPTFRPRQAEMRKADILHHYPDATVEIVQSVPPGTPLSAFTSLSAKHTFASSNPLVRVARNHGEQGVEVVAAKSAPKPVVVPPKAPEVEIVQPLMATTAPVYESQPGTASVPVGVPGENVPLAVELATGPDRKRKGMPKSDADIDPTAGLNVAGKELN